MFFLVEFIVIHTVVEIVFGLDIPRFIIERNTLDVIRDTSLSAFDVTSHSFGEFGFLISCRKSMGQWSFIMFIEMKITLPTTWLT